MAWFKKNDTELKLLGGASERVEADDLPDLADLMNKSLEDLKDEFYLFQIHKLMRRLAKVTVRFNPSDEETEKLFVNSSRLKLDELLVSPAYIDGFTSAAENNENESVPLGAIIDFPFGESAFSSKLVSVKECMWKEIRDITVVLPAMLCREDKSRELKKQLKKLGRIKREIGVAFNAQDMTEGELKTALNAAEKSSVKFITLLFGESGVAEMKEKVTIACKAVRTKPLNVLGNVQDSHTVTVLLKQKINVLYTPFADAIGADILKKFKIKSLKLM